MATKSVQEMAEEYCEDHDECEFARDAFLAGYEAAKAEMNSLEKPDGSSSSNSSNNSNGWISTSYALPEIGKAVLVTHRTSEDYDNLRVMEASRLDDEQYGVADNAAILACYVDYWMVLPAPPLPGSPL